ncbi:MAG: hypothetical protein H7Y05_00540 [Steroidobacteraceae bacterium]|nr:hypothetical protein [Deltaproteobacteria bacterium]
MKIFTLTYCPTPDQLYGNLLALKTLRTGFPTAEINIIDNCSCPQALQQFKLLSDQHGYNLIEAARAVPHDEFISRVIGFSQEPCTIVDPDIIFWEDCESLLTPGIPGVLMRGRLIPALAREAGRHAICAPLIHHSFMHAICAPRIHPSFMVIPDPQRLHQCLLTALGAVTNPWRGKEIMRHGAAVAYDTGARIYEALHHQFLPFSAGEMDRYDHLFFGTHLSSVISGGYYGAGVRGAIVAPHAQAYAGNYSALKGIWRQQQERFNRHALQL